MRGLTLTLTPIILVLVILLTPSFPTQAQSRERTITKAQIEQVIKNHKQPKAIRGQDPDGESPEAKLERLLFCTQGKRGYCTGRRSLVTKELLLRHRTRYMGEECTSHGIYSTALYSSPSSYRGPDSRGPENSDAYEEWLDKLLDTGLTFCSPLNHTSCSSISKKCECRPGTTLNITYDYDGEICSVIFGGNCWIPGVDRPRDSVALYDPVSLDFDLTTRIPDPICPRDEKIDAYGCILGFQLFLNNTCANKEIIEREKTLGKQFKEQDSAVLQPLDFGAPCNFEHHTQLYTTTDAEQIDYKIRIKNLEAIVVAKTRFCSLKALFTCGSGGKCECIEGTTHNQETRSCLFKNPHENCQGNFEKMSAKFSGRVRMEVLEGFNNSRERGCPLNCTQARYSSGIRSVRTPSFCRTCEYFGKNQYQFFGKKCDKVLTLFLEGDPTPSFPIDIPDYDKQLELFVQFNEKAKEFEKLFRLEKNSPCDYVGELEVYRSIRRIKNVELPDKVFTEQNYKDLMSSMDKHIGRFRQRGLCRLYRLRGQAQKADNPLPLNRPLLLCGPTPANSICYEPNNAVYLEELVKRLSGKFFLTTNNSENCFPHPKDIIEYAGKKIGQYKPDTTFGPIQYYDNTYEYLFNTLENHWIGNSQFCNRTGGYECTKSEDDQRKEGGICGFSQDLLEFVKVELEQERLAKLGRNSKSSCHSIQQLISTLLIILHIILLIY